MKLATIIGARPQFIKAAVVSRAISESNKLVTSKSSLVTEVIIHTGQHFDKNMSDIFFEEMHIPKPNYFLNIHGLSHGAMTGQMLEKLETTLIYEKPDCVLVYGDTNTTLAGALAAVKLHIPVAHVEAGLRSFNRKMPEESNRVLTDHASSFLFCPTHQAVQNLANEGIAKQSLSAHKLVSSSAQNRESDQSHNTKNSITYKLSGSNSDPSSPNQSTSLAAMSYEQPPRVALVGDVMLDAAMYYREFARKPGFELAEKFILATIHRAENTEDPIRLKSIFDGINEIGKEVPIYLPLHPRTRKKLEALNLKTNLHKNIKRIEPVSYLEMIYMLENCKMVMTDSGGLQKEAFFFKKPCLTLRNETEWVELVENGFNYLTGAKAETICNVYKNNVETKHDFNLGLYGDGKAGEKIVNFLIQDSLKAL